MSSTTAAPSATAVKAAKFTDFSKNANDFFTKEFPSNQIKVEARTVSKAGLFAARQAFTDEFKITSVRDLATGAVSAEVKNTSSFALLKNKINCKSVSTLNSANQLTQQFTLTNPSMAGVKLDLTSSLNASGANNNKAVLEIAQPVFVTTSTFDWAAKGPVVWTDVSTRYADFQLGGEVGYNMTSQKIDKYSVALSLDRPLEKFTLQALTGFKAFSATYHQRFNEQLEVAFKANWNGKAATSATGLEVGAKYFLVGGGFVKSKLDNFGRLGLSFATDLRSNVQLILGATIETTKLKENVHKFGLELSYSA